MTCSAVTPRSSLTCYTCHTYFPPEFKVKVDAGPGTMFWGALIQDFKYDDYINGRHPTLSESEVCYDMSMYTQEGYYFTASGTYTELKNGVKFSDIKAGEYWNPSFTFRLCDSYYGVEVKFVGMTWGQTHSNQTHGYYRYDLINMNMIGNVCKVMKNYDGSVFYEDCPNNQIYGAYTIPVEEAYLTIFEVEVW